MALEPNKEELLEISQKYLKSLKYEFESYDNIKLFLNLRGVPKNLSKDQEVQILDSILDNQRALVLLFQFVIRKVNQEETELNSNYSEEYLDENLVSQNAKNLIYQMTAMGCFGLDRYSGNFDVNGFFDGSCTKKSVLKVLIYLCELAEFNILENSGYFESISSNNHRLTDREFVSQCCTNIDQLIKKPNLFPLDLHVSQKRSDYEYEEQIETDREMLKKLES